MNSRTILVALRALSLACSPLAFAVAGAAPAVTPKATLIRIELPALDVATPVTVATESCVELLRARKLEAAERPCNSAVDAAETDRMGAHIGPFGRNGYDQEAAITYNNRAVLHYLSGRLTLAAADAARARAAGPLPAVESTAAVIAERRQRLAAE